MSPLCMFITDDILTEILSLLPVKSLLRFKCVSKSWNTLISDPNFVKLHLNKSKSNNPHFILNTHHTKKIKGESPYGRDDEYDEYSIIPYSIRSFLDNPSFTLFADHHCLFNEKGCHQIAGSCNGLICLTGFRYSCTSTGHMYEYCLRLWNPATRAISEKFGCFTDSRYFSFNFGCDNSTSTFKVVASNHIRGELTNVRVLSFGDSVWKHIESFPVVPLNVYPNDAVFFNGALNWLGIHSYIPYTLYHRPNYLPVEQFIIVSLDLGTETYNMYKLPRGFDKVPPSEHSFGVLGDCLCFSYSSYKEEFIIWQMTKFGDEESWTQFLKIRFHDLPLDHDFNKYMVNHYLSIVPLFLSNDGNTLVLDCEGEEQAILYNWRDRRWKKSGVSVHKTVIDDETSDHLIWTYAYSFVESLISIC